MKLKIFSFLVLVACGADAALVTGGRNTPLVDAQGNNMGGPAAFRSTLLGQPGWSHAQVMAFKDMSPAARLEFLRATPGLSGVNYDLLQVPAAVHHPAPAAAAAERRMGGPRVRRPQSPSRGAAAGAPRPQHDDIPIAQTDEEERAMMDHAMRVSLEDPKQQEIQRLTRRIREMEAFRDRQQAEGKQEAAANVTVRIWQEYIRLYEVEGDQGLVDLARGQLAEVERHRAFFAHHPAPGAVAEQGQRGRERGERRRSPSPPSHHGGAMADLSQDPMGDPDRAAVARMSNAELEEERRRLDLNIDRIETIARGGGLVSEDIIRTLYSNRHKLRICDEELRRRRLR